MNYAVDLNDPQIAFIVKTLAIPHTALEIQ